jgi:hypothetical protein
MFKEIGNFTIHIGETNHANVYTKCDKHINLFVRGLKGYNDWPTDFTKSSTLAQSYSLLQLKNSNRAVEKEEKYFFSFLRKKEKKTNWKRQVNAVLPPKSWRIFVVVSDKVQMLAHQKNNKQ